MAAVTKEKKQILTTNAQNGRVVDMKVKPLLLAIKKIMHLATTDISGIVPLEDPGVSDQKIISKISLGNMHEPLIDTVSKISCEISCKCSDVQTTTQTIIETLSSYSLETQIVITLAAFAANYGNFWLVSRLYQKDELAKYVALLQQLPSISESAITLKPKFKALFNVIKAMLDLIDCIFEFKDLSSQFISSQPPEFSKAITYIRQAGSMIIKIIVICSSHTTEFIRSEIMDTSHAELELYTQHGAVNRIHEELKAQLDLCQNHIKTAEANAAFEAWVKLFEATHTDILEVVAAIFSTDNHESLLIDFNQNMIDIGKLKGKNVLLFISDLDVNGNEFSQFYHFYNVWTNEKNQKMEYQFVWVPVLDESIEWTTKLQNQCAKKLNSLPWYMVCDPTRLDRALIRYFKEVWQFKYGKQHLVVLDHKGRVVNSNAIHILRTRGSFAFDFLEVGGWEEDTWSMKFLTAFSFDQLINQWEQAGEYICLYGGDNIQWIENFNKKVETFQGRTGRKINMLYVGKSNGKENVGKCVEKFAPKENRLNSEAFMENIQSFWHRLESMCYYKMQSNINNKFECIKYDNIMKEILTILSFDGSNQGWALISDCSSNMAKGKRDLIETCLDEYEKWMVGVKGGESFVPKLNEYLHAMIFKDHCCLPVILPPTIDIMPPEMPCIICDKPMKKMATYCCCKD